VAAVEDFGEPVMDLRVVVVAAELRMVVLEALELWDSTEVHM
jgi:hypothetical protein